MPSTFTRCRPSGSRYLNVSFLDHCRQCLLGHPARFKKAEEVAALPELGNVQFHLASSVLPVVVPVPVRSTRWPGDFSPYPAPVRLPTSISISRSAANEITSRKISASGVCSTSDRMCIMVSVIAVPSFRFASHNPNLIRKSRRPTYPSSYITSGDIIIRVNCWPLKFAIALQNLPIELLDQRWLFGPQVRSNDEQAVSSRARFQLSSVA